MTCMVRTGSFVHFTLKDTAGIIALPIWVFVPTDSFVRVFLKIQLTHEFLVTLERNIQQTTRVYCMYVRIYAV